MERIRSGPRRSSSARWRSSDLIPSRHPLPSPPARFAEWRIGHPLRPPSRPLPPGPSLRHMSIAHDPPLHTSRRSPRLARDFPTGRKSGSVPPHQGLPAAPKPTPRPRPPRRLNLRRLAPLMCPLAAAHGACQRRRRPDGWDGSRARPDPRTRARPSPPPSSPEPRAVGGSSPAGRLRTHSIAG